MLNLITTKLAYWSEILKQLDTSKDNAKSILQAIADDISQWVDICETAEELMDQDTEIEVVFDVPQDILH
jgi:hypothetical protein